MHPLAGHVPTEHWTLAPVSVTKFFHDSTMTWEGRGMQRALDCRTGIQGQNKLPELQGCCAPAGGGKAESLLMQHLLAYLQCVPP